MLQYRFSAVDRMGNNVDGTVSAANEALAANQIGQMGYQLIALETVAVYTEEGNGDPGPIGLTAGVPANFAPAPVDSRPRPIDLTQPIDLGQEYLPSSGGYGQDSNATVEMDARPLQPWERGGPIASLPAPAMTMSMSGAVIARRGMPLPGESGGSTREMPRHPGRAERVPADAESKPMPLSQRFMQTLIYPIFSGVVIKDLAQFYRQFATMIGAGLPIFQALSGLEANTKNAKLKKIARQGMEQVQAGGRFSDILAASPWIFKPVQVQLLRAAEEGGMLEQTLRQMAEYVEHDWEIKRLIDRETMYPKLVLFAALMILGRPFIVSPPEMALVNLVLSGMGKKEYSGAQYLLDTIGFGLLLLALVVVPYVIYRLFLFNVPRTREALDTFKNAIPGFGKMAKMFAMARFGRTMAALYRAGFGMSHALEISGDAGGNAVLRGAVQRAIPIAERGGLVSDALRSSSFFTPMTLDMFRTGETSGRLDEMLDKMADFYEAEGKLKTHQAALIFGTAVLLIVAILVGIAVISFYAGYGQGVSSAGGG